MVKVITVLFLFMLQLCASYAQCDQFEDYESNASWTQVGEWVTINQGVVDFQNGSSCGTDRRVYKSLDQTITDEDCWEISFEFFAREVGEFDGHNFPGHMLIGISENEISPFGDCPDVECTGKPPSTQQSIFVLFGTTNPPDGNMHYRIVFKDKASWNSSDFMIYNSIQENHYFNLKKDCERIELCVYRDEERSSLIANCLSMTIEAHNDMNYLQHGSSATGFVHRELTGYVDNTCVNMSDCSKRYYYNYSGCVGDDFEIVFNDVVYNEQNPTGEELLMGSDGSCDSLLLIELEFEEVDMPMRALLTVECGEDSIIDSGTLYTLNGEEISDIMTSGIYLFASNESSECSLMDTLEVTFLPAQQIYFPNIIHVGSAYNGCFGPTFSRSKSIEYNLSIYDRWGNQVFQQSGKDISWCPSPTGIEAGVYVYLIEINNSCYESPICADITVLK